MTITPGLPRSHIQARFPNGQILEGPPGTRLADFVRAAAPDGHAIAALLNGKLRELTTPLTIDSEVNVVTTTSTDGARIYRRGLVFLFVTAAAEVFPNVEVYIEHSAATSGAYYCETRGRDPFTPEELKLIEARMRAIVDRDEPFLKTQVPLAEAMELFKARGEQDKVRLLSHRKKDSLVLYRLRDYADYHQGYMPPSAGYLRQFALHAFPPGFMLQFPHQSHPDELDTIAPYPKLFAVFEEAGNWLDRLGLRNVGALNDAIVGGRLLEVSLIAEALHSGRIARIAADIAAQRERIKVVLIAGPSASGKTTFSKRLAVQLLANGLRPFPLGLDDYFVDRARTPRDASGQLDYENLHALDVARFNDNLLTLMAGKTAQLPHYDFITGQSGPGHTVTLDDDTVLIIEGIHGLNPALVPDLPAERLYRVYISALTQLNLDRHNRVSTTDGRLLRRLVRDAATRGYSANDTLRRWDSVMRGEKQNIFPFQENGDAIFNSALAHELAVLRPLAEPLLLSVRPDTPEYVEANRLLSFLHWFRPAPADHVPTNSILREFISPPTLFDQWDWAKFSGAGEG